MDNIWLNVCSFNEIHDIKNLYHLVEKRLKNNDGIKIHPTQKPENLISRVIMSSTKINDIVLDPFFGTGTTGVVAKKLNRNFIGIEENKEYVKQSIKRIKNTLKLLLLMVVQQTKLLI